MTKPLGKTAVTLAMMMTLSGCATKTTKPVAFDPAHWKTDAEQQRLTRAYDEIPAVASRWHPAINNFASQWQQTQQYDQAMTLVTEAANNLWQQAKQDMRSRGDYDDRPLYWARLGFNWVIANSTPGFVINDSQRTALQEQFEEVSRGRQDLAFTTDAPLKILITGFDPFLLDRNISQGNPSGIAALALDGQVIEYQGRKAEINAVIFPVRYGDFDAGEVESLLTPFYTDNTVDMVVTISQGRTEFDLERFPGKRRSAGAPGNLNIYTGASSRDPIIPMLNQQPLPGPEFVEFSLPVTAMQQASGEYRINDNHQVTTLEDGEIEAASLAQLEGKTAVRGGGGGYLSNEISYRSIRLRNHLGSAIPTGHIHTPILRESTPVHAHPIIEQITGMLQRALPSLKTRSK
ncbi:hypothetical protein ACWJJH_02150 [Endozoicomonadaceae bacterium StTr2]